MLRARSRTPAATPTPALCVKETSGGEHEPQRPRRKKGAQGNLPSQEVLVGGEGAPGGGASSRPQSWSWCFRAISGDPGAPTCPQARNYVSQVLQIGAAEVTASLRPGEEQEGPCPSLGGRRGRRAWIKGLPKSPAPCVVCS